MQWTGLAAGTWISPFYRVSYSSTTYECRVPLVLPASPIVPPLDTVHWQLSVSDTYSADEWYDVFGATFAEVVRQLRAGSSSPQVFCRLAPLTGQPKRYEHHGRAYEKEAGCARS